MEIDIESIENGIAPVACIHFLEQTLFAIVVGHRQGMLPKLGEAAFESIVGIIISPRQFAAASWTRRVDVDVMKLLVEDRSALRARQSAWSSARGPARRTILRK